MMVSMLPRTRAIVWGGNFCHLTLYAFIQPFGELLLRDGFTLVSSTIEDKELGSTLVPEITGSPQVLIQSASDTGYAECPILLVVHCWQKDWAGCVRLGGYLGEEAQPGKQCDTSIGKSEIRGLAAQHVHIGCSTSRGDCEQEGSFPGKLLKWAGRYGLKWGLGQGLQNYVGVIIWGMPLECS